MDHGIAALSAVNVAFISEEDMRELVSRPQLTRALWWATLVDEGVLRAWIVNLGQRNAFDRVANLFCELHVRMRNIGAAPDGVFELPLTQEQLADTLGLSAVHINRTLMRLKADGLIKLGSKTLTILDPAGLRAASGFDDSYLHTERDSARW
jgi:CRP-like cAMP-binding protein